MPQGDSPELAALDRVARYRSLLLRLDPGGPIYADVVSAKLVAVVEALMLGVDEELAEVRCAAAEFAADGAEFVAELRSAVGQGQIALPPVRVQNGSGGWAGVARSGAVAAGRCSLP
ncbi:hypothetical protein NDR87_36550 [Nocardia sp. CDC159]|uniref:Uncharacterized protein n=1 Tax=Nocardia pulmonis TaxID=2951408 RepID=A0A9X2EEM6_9NOCA|nr:MULTISPECIES: hypothetical protein [Nocardia]MCM6779016.1 hypothetical protein [Nocardia pulmonis]MCM6791888.1 hypothetical protein [Nocardia sp. CDC159]